MSRPTFSVVDRVTGEEVGLFRYDHWWQAEKHAAGLRATTHPRAEAIEGAPEMPRRNTRRGRA